MLKHRISPSATRICAAIGIAAAAASAQLAPTSRILIVTGGHDYDMASFNAMWAGFGAAYTVRPLAVGHEVFDDITGWNYDILVFYNHQNPGNSLTARHQENFKALLNRGVGMFVLHHSVAAYPHFPEFEAMAGGKYRSSAYYRDTLSTAKIPVKIDVLAAKTGHPLAEGVAASFSINDEMYYKMAFAADNDVVFKTDIADADGPIAWSRRAGNSRVFATLLGHGPASFSNANFRRMVKNGLDHILPCAAGDAREACKPGVSIAIPAKRRAPGENLPGGWLASGRIMRAGFPSSAVSSIYSIDGREIGRFGHERIR